MLKSDPLPQGIDSIFSVNLCNFVPVLNDGYKDQKNL